MSLPEALVLISIVVCITTVVVVMIIRTIIK